MTRPPQKNQPAYSSYWPVAEAKAEGFYFYDVPITAYHSATEVSVKGYGKMLLFGGYSYLSLHLHPTIQQAAARSLEAFGTGGHGVRLLAGTTDLHHQLERSIRDYKNTSAAVTYSSGYLANISAIGALVGRNDTIFSDQLNHASINDGCRLSRARVQRYQHNDMDQLAYLLRNTKRGKKLVVTDAVFSMDGDLADLPELAKLCHDFEAQLMVDECHALGVLGKRGTGIEEHFEMPPDTIDIKMGTLSKTIPSQGGYVAGSTELCTYLRHHSVGFIYSGANTPANTAAAVAAFEVMQQEPGRVTKLQDNAAYARSNLRQLGFDIMSSQTPIIPILIGSDEVAYRTAQACQAKGIFIQAIPHPVVPKGQARLRLAINTAHTQRQIDQLLSVLVEVREQIGTPS